MDDHLTIKLANHKPVTILNEPKSPICLERCDLLFGQDLCEKIVDKLI